ncbi:phospholipase D-like domain-containing protein [Roseiarcaceae bacterium H3SJ34-1]|uniref:phospholipase D-like domain-containing protein n=1 Tax=Terripilifer ovatus TaxID=3032367 RepID=UPI003AB971D6|nr:phospholipase D-like domain-containing protein [Roseiarcaceae bacterium H3SJ34-1]
MRRSIRSGLCLIAFTAVAVSYVPVTARGPLDGEPNTARVRLFYAPRDNLSEVDRAVIAGASHAIDFTGYVLTDRAIAEALTDAARRGVKVRIYLDPDQPALKSPRSSSAFWTLVRQNGVETRIKTGGNDLMHLKAYHVDARILRTGSANFSVSGSRYQDNDLLLLEGRDTVAQFVREFEYMWNRSGSTPLNPDTQRPAPRRYVGGDDRP